MNDEHFVESKDGQSIAIIIDEENTVVLIDLQTLELKIFDKDTFQSPRIKFAERIATFEISVVDNLKKEVHGCDILAENGLPILTYDLDELNLDSPEPWKLKYEKVVVWENWEDNLYHPESLKFFEMVKFWLFWAVRRQLRMDLIICLFSPTKITMTFTHTSHFKDFIHFEQFSHKIELLHIKTFNPTYQLSTRN